MAVVRENILNGPDVADPFLDGVVMLDQTGSGLMASDIANFLEANQLDIPMNGIEQEMSIYDLFVLWHLVAMRIPLSVGNAAHDGPIFLPWHRMYMIRLEQMLQQVTGNADLAIPYWDWAADGSLPVSEQWRAPLWSARLAGESRGAVRSGRVGQMRVRLVQNSVNGGLSSVSPRQIERRAGFDAPDLPTAEHVQAAMDASNYDHSPWNRASTGHRNLLEGWWTGGSQLHNRVHVWIGGDMSPGTSPNDPVFFLNHCFVDRLWQQWMDENGNQYEPGAGRGPAGHRIDSAMIALIGEALTPAGVLDASAWYNYDSALT